MEMKVGQKGHCCICLVLCWIACSEGARCCSMRTRKQSQGELHVARSCHSIPRASNHMTVPSCTHPPGLVQPSGLQPWPASCWPPHEKSWARTTRQNHSWIPDPQKLCEIINVCCFKLPNFVSQLEITDTMTQLFLAKKKKKIIDLFRYIYVNKVNTNLLWGENV